MTIEKRHYPISQFLLVKIHTLSCHGANAFIAFATLYKITMSDYIQQMIRITKEDLEYAHMEAGRVCGGGKGSMAKFWHLVLENWRNHSGETKPE